jgi:peroxiredoxin
MTMLRALILILVSAAHTAVAMDGAKSPPPASPAAQQAFKKLRAEFNLGVEAIRADMLKKMSLSEVNQKLWTEGPFERLASFGPRYLALARENPRTDVAWDCVQWVVYVRGFSKADKAAALDQMLRDHIDDETFYADLYFHLYRPGGDLPSFYREVLKLRHAPERVAGLARYSLAVWLLDHPTAKQTGEARELFQQVTAKYARLPHPYNPKKGTLGDAAAHQLFEIDHLQVGKAAPEILGKDFQGAALRLSDYRGKVVLLVFCGDWCGPCRKLYPYERKWTEELRHRPFAVVGVNSDAPSKLKAAIDREKFTFRWFADGGVEGPISARWNVELWPTIYVLDSQGKIRLKKRGVGHPEPIKECIDKVLTESDRSAKTPS